MIFKDFEIHASPFICNAYCKKDDEKLVEVSNGFLGTDLYCPKCKSIYILKLIKVAKMTVTKEYRKQCEDEVNRKNKEKK